MSLYDTFRELPLHIEEVVTDVHVYQVSPEFTRKTTVVHLRPEPYFRHIGPEGLGEDVTYDADEHEPHRWPWVDLLGDWTLESFSARLDEVDLFPARRAAAARLPRLPPLGVRVGRARPGAEAGAALDRRGARPRVPRRHVRLLDARDRRSTTGSRSTPTSASSSTRRPSGRTRCSPTLAGRGNVDVIDLKGQYKGTVVDNPGDPELYRRVAEALPERVDRGSRPDPRDRRRARAVPRPDHVGRADPLVGRRRGAAVRAEVPEREAVALRHARSGCSSSTSAARRRASSSTAAGSSSSASAAGRSRSSRRCSRPTARTTWRPAATTRTSRSRASRRARSGRCPSATASGAASRADRRAARLRRARAGAPARRSARAPRPTSATPPRAPRRRRARACRTRRRGSAGRGGSARPTGSSARRRRAGRRRASRTSSPVSSRASRSAASASEPIARLDVPAGLEPAAALRVVDEQRARAASSTTTAEP